MAGDHCTLGTAMPGMGKPVERVVARVALVGRRISVVRRGIEMTMWRVGSEVHRILSQVLQFVDSSRRRSHRPDGRDERQHDADQASAQRSICDGVEDHADGGYMNCTRGSHTRRVPAR